MDIEVGDSMLSINHNSKKKLISPDIDFVDNCHFSLRHVILSGNHFTVHKYMVVLNPMSQNGFFINLFNIIFVTDTFLNNKVQNTSSRYV